MENFIRTKDAETAKKLIEEGFEQFSEDHGEYVFLNKGKVHEEKKPACGKAAFSNRIWG